MARNAVSPIDFQTPLVNEDRTPSLQFIRLWQQLFNNENGTYSTAASALQNSVGTDVILGRRSAGSGVIEQLTLSQALDLVGTTAQGDILYRGATGWTRLPAGSTGQVLETKGVGFNPQWAAASGGGPIIPTGSTAFGGATFDTGAYATNANFYVPLVDTSFSKVATTFSNVTVGNIYSVFLATVNTSFNITGTVATASNPYTTTATGLQNATFNMVATMNAGVGYIVGLVVTNGSGTTACHALFQNSLFSYLNCPFDLTAVFAYASSIGSPRRINYAQTSSSPTTGAPVNNSSSSASAIILLP